MQAAVVKLESNFVVHIHPSLGQRVLATTIRCCKCGKTKMKQSNETHRSFSAYVFSLVSQYNPSSAAFIDGELATGGTSGRESYLVCREGILVSPEVRMISTTCSSHQYSYHFRHAWAYHSQKCIHGLSSIDSACSFHSYSETQSAPGLCTRGEHTQSLHSPSRHSPAVVRLSNAITMELVINTRTGSTSI